MAQAAARLGRKLAGLGVEDVCAAVLDGDAGGHEALGRVLFERGLEMRVEAQSFECGAKLARRNQAVTSLGRRGARPRAGPRKPPRLEKRLAEDARRATG